MDLDKDNKNFRGIFQIIDDGSGGVNTEYPKLDTKLYQTLKTTHWDDKASPGHPGGKTKSNENFFLIKQEWVKEIYRINHTAKQVPYEIKGFVEKNRDSIAPNYLNIRKDIALVKDVEEKEIVDKKGKKCK